MDHPQETNDIPTLEQIQSSNGEHLWFTTGKPIPWFARQPINHANTLLDLRYLCRGGGMLVIAPSGQGKSTLSIQMTILWSAGRIAFGIIPQKPWRILVIQSEDDEGDCTEMSAMINHLGLTKIEIELVENNTELVRCNHLSGSKFITALRHHLQEARDAGMPFDLVIINPYSTYLGDDVLNAKANSDFLNHLLNPLLTEFNVAAVIIHHTPKTNYRDFSKLNPWDFQYAGAGSAQMTNWARAILVIVPQEPDAKVFMFVAAKRGKRLELWGDSITRYFKHSEPGDVLRWDDATTDQCHAATDARNQKKTSGRRPSASINQIIEACVSLTDWLTEARIYDIAQETLVEKRGFNAGQKKVHDAIIQGISEDSVSKREVPRSTGKPLIEYIRNKPNNLRDSGSR